MYDSFLEHLNLSFPEQQQLHAYLKEYVTDHKLGLFDKIIPQRTRHITLVLEDIFQSQNASAVLRTSEALGIQDVHIIEDEFEYQLNPRVTIGCAKWLSLFKYQKPHDSTLSCINYLKEKGYQIIGTTPHSCNNYVKDLDLTKPTALILGNEKRGMSDVAMKHCDGFVKIPMYGFSESLNISVSAAILLHELLKRVRSSTVNWQLKDIEKFELEIQWYYNSITRAEDYVKNFIKTIKTTSNSMGK